MFLTINSVSQTGLSFASQNAGIKNYKRVDQVLYRCIMIQLLLGSGVGLFVYALRPLIFSIYSSDPEVIAQGSIILSLSTLTYGICALMDMIPCVVRGLGYSLPPMIISVAGVVGMRFIWIFGYFPSHHTLWDLYLSYLISWIITATAHIICYIIIRKKIEKQLCI